VPPAEHVTAPSQGRAWLAKLRPTGIPAASQSSRSISSQNSGQRRHCLWAVSQDAAVPLWDGDHPLPHWNGWNHPVGAVRSRPSHPPTGAGRTATAALARERNQEALTTATTPCPCKPKTKESAGQIPAELRRDMAADGLPVLVMLSQPALDQSITMQVKEVGDGRRLRWRASISLPERELIVDGRRVLATVQHGVDVDEAAVHVVEDREWEPVRHGPMKAPIFAVHAAVLQQAVDVVKEPANEVSSATPIEPSQSRKASRYQTMTALRLSIGFFQKRGGRREAR